MVRCGTNGVAPVMGPRKASFEAHGCGVYIDALPWYLDPNSANLLELTEIQLLGCFLLQGRSVTPDLAIPYEVASQIGAVAMLWHGNLSTRCLISSW
jgi:hypothetical protein